MDTRGPKPSPKRLESMKKGELFRLAIKPICESVSIYDGGRVFLRQVSKVAKAQGLLFAAHWCEYEVCSGGLHQFFYNSTGVLAPEAIEGFRFIGIPKAATLVAKAVELYGDSYPRDRGDRFSKLKPLLRPGKKREDWDPFCKLDDAFYQKSAAGEFEAMADRFVRRHLRLFFV